MDALIDWLKEIFHADNPTIAGIIITITTFVLGYILNAIFKEIGSFKRRSSYRKIVMINIRLAINQVDDICKTLLHLSNEIKVDRETNLIFGYNMMPSIAVLQNIGYENLYSTYFTGFENIFGRNKQKLEAINSLWNSIEFFKHSNTNNGSEYEFFYTNYTKLEELFKSLSFDIQANLDEVIVTHKFNDPYSNINDFFHDYRGVQEKYLVGKRTLSKSELNNYHKSIKEIYHKNKLVVIEFKNELKTSEIIALINKAGMEYINLDNLCDRSSFYYLDLRKSYFLNQKQLQDVIEVIA